QPAGGDDEVAEGASFAITYTAADTDSVATVDLFYREGSSVDCDADGIGDWSAITTGEAEGSGAIYSWTTPTTAGNYYICGRISDEAQTVYAVSSSYVTVNDTPTIAVDEPGGGNDAVIAG